MRDSGTNRSRQQKNLPIDQRPPGNRSGSRGSAGQERQKGPGQPSTGQKERDARTGDSYGTARDPGEPRSR